MSLDISTLRNTVQSQLNNPNLTHQDYLLLSQIVDVLDDKIALSDVIAEGTNQVSNVSSEGSTQITNVQNAGDQEIQDLQNTAAGLITALQTEGQNQLGLVSGYVRTTSSTTQVITSDVTINGDFSVTGSSSVINTSELNVSDSTITLNSGTTGAPSLDSGIIVERGDEQNVSFLWIEADDNWYSGSPIKSDNGFLGNASTATRFASSVTIELGGALAGTVTFSGDEASNVQLSASIATTTDYLNGEVLSNTAEGGLVAVDLFSPNSNRIRRTVDGADVIYDFL